MVSTGLIAVLILGACAPSQVEPARGQPEQQREELRIAYSALSNEALDPLKAPLAAMRYLTFMFDSLVGVKKIQEYLLDESGRPLFFGFGRWHPYTNEIKPLFSINDAIFIARKSDQILWRYWFGPKPYLYVTGSLESIDINFPEDLEMAEAARIYLERKQSG